MLNRKLLNKSKIRKISLLFLTAVFLLVLVSARETNYFDPQIPGWYSVDSWELEVCQKWGGTDEAASGATSSKPIYLSQTTLSLQGRKQVYSVSGFNQTLYTVSWYLEPMSPIGYRVELINEEAEVEYRISDGTASYSSPAIGYKSDYYDTGYTHVGMIYGSEWLKVPLIELE